MACKDSVGRARRVCVDWQRTQQLRCANWRQTWTALCTNWQTEWERRCERWRTESERRCDRWEEERTRECSDWIVIFRWLCLAWTWVTTLVCRAWTWVTTTICEAWTWVSTLVCRAWVFIGSLVCDLWVIVTTLVCRAWVFVLDTWCLIWCAIRRLFAPNEFSESRSECIYGWTSAYRAELDDDCQLRITLRIRLNPDPDVSAADLAAARTRWEQAIENAWSGQHTMVLTDGSCSCKRITVTVDVQWVTSNEHHTVRVRSGTGRANMTNWFVTDSGATAAHEAGHMFGNPDEYADSNCPNRTVTSDNSLMQTLSGVVHVRHYESWQRWLSNRTCCTYVAR